MPQLTLDSFDGRWLDGFLFCRRAYALFNQIHDAPDGISRLRNRTSDTEKKLVEELLPIAKFIQLKVRPGRCLRVRWVYGNQPFDAVIQQTGSYVTNGCDLAKAQLEVTGVYHPNHYLAREALEKGEPVFGLDGLFRDPETRQVVSKSTVRTNYDFVEHFADQVTVQISKKAGKPYRPGTILLVECNLDTPYDEHEWSHLVKYVRAKLCLHPFSEIFIYDSLLERNTSFFPG